MKPLELYKHKNCRDVAILVLKSFYVAEGDYYKLRVKWMNVVNPENIFYTGVQENLKIDVSKLKDWELIG